ncbi:MAG: SRPBCC family protein [Solirubrobacteraceae bacterium]
MSPTPTNSNHVSPSPAPRTVTNRVGAVGARRGERTKKTGTTTIRYEARTTIDRPIGDVFARLADLDGYGTWMRRTGLFRRSGQTSDGPLGPGTTYFDATRMGTFRGQITDYQLPSRIGFRETLQWFGFDLTEARPEYFLEADRDRTIVHHVAEGELFGPMRVMKPIAALLARSERTRTVESLRRSLESQ